MGNHKSVQLLSKSMNRNPMEIFVTLDILALDKIMTYLSVRDLLSCRRVSEMWNRAASFELRVRRTMIKIIWKESQLMELEERMERSWNFPFAGLKLDRPWELQSDAAMDFFQNYGARFTRLHLGTCWMESMHDLAPFINHLPNLSVLELGHFPDIPINRFSHSAARQNDAVLKLSNVQTIRIFRTVPGHCEQVLGQVLKAAASPSLQIELLDAIPGILTVVKSAGKLGAVSVMKFDDDKYSWKFGSKMDQLLPTGSPSLTKLDFNLGGCLSKYGLKKVLFASQRTLKELHLSGICLSELSVYKRLAFTKLTTLTYYVYIRHDPEYFFRGRHQCNFPALRHVKLKISYGTKYHVVAVFVDDLVFPTVTSIDLDGYVDEDGMKKLAQIFSNVIEMRLESGQFMKYGRNPSEMWNVRAFKYLKQLVIWNFIVGRPAEPYMNMDSFLTGMPFKECQKLNFNKIKFKETLRVTPNMLELESLEQLVVCIKLAKELVQPTTDAPFISMVTVRYALEMMPNMRAKFVYQPSLLTRRDNEVLEAAFKPVQEYVKIERFFY